jgi:hypothetical protein
MSLVLEMCGGGTHTVFIYLRTCRGFSRLNVVR